MKKKQPLSAFPGELFRIRQRPLIRGERGSGQPSRLFTGSSVKLLHSPLCTIKNGFDARLVRFHRQVRQRGPYLAEDKS